MKERSLAKMRSDIAAMKKDISELKKAVRKLETRRKKRKVGAYQKFVGGQLRKGKTIAEAPAAWKEKKRREEERIDRSLRTAFGSLSHIFITRSHRPAASSVSEHLQTCS